MFKNFSQHVLDVFAKYETSADQISKLMTDVALGREIYDDVENRVISTAEANEKIYNFSLDVLGMTKEMSDKDRRRAWRDNHRAWFDIIEDTIDIRISTGFKDPWFEDLVESKNIANGDRQDFYSEHEAILAVSKVGTSHHDLILQRIGIDQPISIPVERFAIKIGEDINKYLIGQTDWAKMINAIAKAYEKKVYEMVSYQITQLSTKLPGAFVGSGALNSTNKPDFDAIIEKVSAANDGADVIVMGTKLALKKITALADVNWAAKMQRDYVAETGTIGIYEGTRLVEIPQRYSDRTFADAKKLMDDTKLIFLPVGYADKPIKFVDRGTTEVNEILDKGEQNGRWDDLMSYEVQREFGAGLVLGSYLGQWTLPS